VTAGAWNLLLYAIAGDREEHERVTGAIARMHEALTTDRCNVAVQLHASSRTTRHWISRGQQVQTDVLPAVVDVSEPSSLTMFMNAAHRKLAAESTALMLWAHSTGLDHVHDYTKKQPRPAGPGGGPAERSVAVLGGDAGPGEVIGEPASHLPPAATVRDRRAQRFRGHRERYGCRWGPDPNTGEYLTNVGMRKAIAQSSQKRVDILGLNACWMASLEVEYELRSVSEVQVASQVSAEPWPYGAIIAALSAAPGMTAQQLAAQIVAVVRDEIAAGARRDAISALLSGPALDDLASAFDAYARRARILIDSDWEAVSRAVMAESQRVDDPYQVDLMSLIHELSKHDLKAKIAAASVATKFAAMVVGHAASDAHPGVQGLSVFCPETSQVDLAEAYQGTEFRSNAWAAFLKAFQARLTRSPSA
jgi:hypothetical protein